jgi:hypothetical protein
MKFIKENQTDPDFLASLDRKSNIIMCIRPTEEESLIELDSVPDTFRISLSRDLNLSMDNIKIALSVLATNFKPNIKICFPAGLKIQFSELVEDSKQDIFWKIYKSFILNNVYNDHNFITHHLVSDIAFVMYMDTLRMREANVQMLIKKGTPVIDFYVTWYVQTKRDMPQIEEIYLISDNHIYEDFVNIF